MSRTLAEVAVQRRPRTRVRLEWCEPAAGRPLPQAELDELARLAPSVWCPAASIESDFVAVARDAASGQIVGLVAASRYAVGDDPVLVVEHALAEPGSSQAGLLRRLLAMALLQKAGIDGLPSAVVLRGTGDWVAAAFARMAETFTGSLSYPAPPGRPVPLATASLARRVARGLTPSIRYDLATSVLRGARLGRGRTRIETTEAGSAALDVAAPAAVTAYDEVLLVLDLRHGQEAVLLEDARKAYRRR